MGHKVLTASSVAEALEAHRTHQADCIVSDIGLPDGRGLDLLPRLQAVHPAPAISVSGYGMDADARGSRGAGFLCHLVKPVTGDKLTAAVEELLASCPMQ
jgi:CheY-like chemotaxis protein